MFPLNWFYWIKMNNWGIDNSISQIFCPFPPHTKALILGNTQLLYLWRELYFSFQSLDGRWTLPELLSLLSWGARLATKSPIDLVIVALDLHFSPLFTDTALQSLSLQPWPLASLSRCSKRFFCLTEAWFFLNCLTLPLKDAPVFSLLILCPAHVINALRWLHLRHMMAGISQPCGVFALLEEKGCNSDVPCGERDTHTEKFMLISKRHDSQPNHIKADS